MPIYNPFEKKKKEDFTLPWGTNTGSLPFGTKFPNQTTNSTPNQSVNTASSPQNSSRNRGVYQNGQQIGSSEKQVVLPSYTPPAPTPKPTNQQSNVPSYITSFKDLAARKRENAAGAKQRQDNYYTNSYAERNRALGAQVPKLQQQFSDTQGFFQKGLANAQQKADYDKQNITDATGSLQREAAQTRQESAARTGQKFAGLNTTDSFGFGSHGRAQENIESDFNRFTQENLRSAEQQKFEVDSNLQEYELTAQQKIDDVRIKLDNVIAQIYSDQTLNDIEKQGALDGVFGDYQSVLDGIDTEMNGVYERYAQSLAELEKNGLSDGFMNTGIPENEADFKMKFENPDEYEAMFESQGVSEKSQDAIDTITTIDDILGRDLHSVLGPLEIRGTALGQSLLGGKGYDTKQLIENVRGNIELSAAGKLKGQGPISEGEREILKRAAAALSTSMSETEFRIQLNKVRDILGRNVNDYQAGSRTIKVISPNGEHFNIDESELEEAQNNGWRRV